MPVEAEDLAEELTFLFLDKEEWLQEWQRRVIARSTTIQDTPKALLAQASGIAAVGRQMRDLNRQTLEHFRQDFDPIFLAGARTIDPAYLITRGDRANLARLNTDEYLKIRGASQTTILDAKRFVEMVRNDRPDRRKLLGIKYNRVDFRRTDKTDLNQLDLQKALRAVQMTEAEKTLLTSLAESTRLVDNTEQTMRLRGVRAIAYSDGKRYKLGDYGSMVSRTNASRAYNLGIFKAARKRKIEFLYVMDGPECGWTFHDDPNPANGEVVSVDEAAAYPLAHPNCRRTFRPATPEEIRGSKEKREKREKEAKAKKRKKVAKKAAIVAGASFGTLAATNLLAGGLERLATSQFFDEMVRRIAVMGFQGDASSQRLVVWLRRFQTRFGDLSDLRVPTYSMTPRQAAAARAQKLVASIYPNSPIELPDLTIVETIRGFAEGFIEGLHLERIPAAIKRAVGAAERATVLQMGDRFQKFYFTLKKAALSEDTADNIRSIIDFEAKRRGMFYRVLERIPGAPQLRASWSSWGPRTRIDVTDWIRGRVTVTPTGLIRSLSVNAAGQVRSVLKMYQDGTIGGHISVLPKKFLRGAVRGIIEIDDNGRLLGNIRLVPGGPLRIRAEFITTGARTDLKDFMKSPLGAIGNIAERFREFKFNRLIIELRVFNRSIFDISANLRIPIKVVRQNIDRLVGEGLLTRGPDGRLTGLFRHIVHDPRILREIFGDIVDESGEVVSRGVRSTIFGNIRFSSLTQETVDSSPFLSFLQKQNVRLLNRAHLTVNGLQDVVSNMRIHGWNIYDIGNVLKLRWNQVKTLAENGVWRLRNFMEDLGVVNVEQILPVWEDRVKAVTNSFRRSVDGAQGNRADAIKDALRAIEIGADEAKPRQIRNMMRLADIKPGEPTQKIYNKMRNVVEYIATHEGLDDGELRRIARGLREQSDFKLRAFANDIGKRNDPNIRILRVTSAQFDEINKRRFPLGGGRVDVFTRDKRRGPYGEWSDSTPKFQWEGSVLDQEHSPGKYRTGRIIIVDNEGRAADVEWPEINNLMKNPFRFRIQDSSPYLWDDFFDEYAFMAERYRNAPRPLANIVPNEHDNGPFYHRLSKSINVPAGTRPADGPASDAPVSVWWHHWRTYLNDLVEEDKKTFLKNGPENVWIHEYGHHLSWEMMENDPTKMVEILNEVAQHIGADVVLHDPFSSNDLEEQVTYSMSIPTDEVFVPAAGQPSYRPMNDMAAELGTYSGETPNEMIAEALTDYLTQDRPGAIATIVGQAFDTYFGAA